MYFFAHRFIFDQFLFHILRLVTVLQTLSSNSPLFYLAKNCPGMEKLLWSFFPRENVLSSTCCVLKEVTWCNRDGQRMWGRGGKDLQSRHDFTSTQSRAGWKVSAGAMRTTELQSRKLRQRLFLSSLVSLWAAFAARVAVCVPILSGPLCRKLDPTCALGRKGRSPPDGRTGAGLPGKRWKPGASLKWDPQGHQGEQSQELPNLFFSSSFADFMKGHFSKSFKTPSCESSYLNTQKCVLCLISYYGQNTFSPALTSSAFSTFNFLFCSC